MVFLWFWRYPIRSDGFSIDWALHPRAFRGRPRFWVPLTAGQQEESCKKMWRNAREPKQIQGKSMTIPWGGAAVQWKLANALPVSFPNLLGPRLRGGPRRPRANSMRWNSIPAFPPGRIGGRGSNPLNSYWKFNTLFVKHCISLRLRCDTGRAGPFGPFGQCFSETLAN